MSPIQSVIVLLSLSCVCLALPQPKVQYSVGGTATANIGDVAMDIARIIREDASKHASAFACIRSLFNEYHYKVTRGTGNALMVFKLSNESSEGVSGLIHYQTHECGGEMYGVWIFQCGKFLNKGSRGFENWRFASGCYHRYNDGNGVYFENDECPDSAYRETHRC